MEAAERFAAEVGVFEGMGVGDMDACSRYEGMEFVGGVREGAKELSEIQDEGEMWSQDSSVDSLYFPGGSICNTL